MSKTFDIGISTAYGAAVRGGYAGTYEQFCADLARLADVLEEFLGFSVTIQTLAEGQQATASYENGILSLGIPKGDTGNGIQSISLLSTVGQVKTYRITYTNGNHFDFPVADGKGISNTTLNADYTLTITYTDGTTWTSGSIRGQVGATPHLTIGTVETLPPSQSASATITGTDENPVLNLGIPKGDTGEVSQAEFDALSDDVDDLSRHLSDVETSLVKRNQWNLKSLDIRKGFTAAAALRPDSFTIRLDVSGGQTIHCYAGITVDIIPRRTYAFDSNGTRLDYYNGFVERDINLPANTAYILMTADWDNRDKVYIRDASNNYLFRYDKSIEYPANHNYKTIRVASWNVGAWNSEYNWIDGAAVKTTHTGAELKELLKTLFTELNADIITLTEYLDTFDGVNIYNDVLKHFYPYYYTWAQESGSVVPRVGVFSRFPLYLISYYTVYQAASDFIGGYIMLDFETQIGFSGINLLPDSAADRIAQANAVANMYNSYNMALFCGDMNTGNNGESDADIQAQITPFTDNGYEPSNRGYWGDIPTYYQPKLALDNIYVKGGIINKFTVVEDRPGSDHNPIVSDITFFA